jgi:hypothetical protein
MFDNELVFSEKKKEKKKLVFSEKKKKEKGEDQSSP